jgi:hypothetical protein
LINHNFITDALNIPPNIPPRGCIDADTYPPHPHEYWPSLKGKGENKKVDGSERIKIRVRPFRKVFKIFSEFFSEKFFGFCVTRIALKEEYSGLSVWCCVSGLYFGVSSKALVG